MIHAIILFPKFYLCSSDLLLHLNFIPEYMIEISYNLSKDMNIE